MAIPTAMHPGLWLELKRIKGGVVSEEQNTFEMHMRAVGFACVICKGWEEATRAIKRYLLQP